MIDVKELRARARRNVRASTYGEDDSIDVSASTIIELLDALETSENLVASFVQASNEAMNVSLTDKINELEKALEAADDFINYVEAKQMTYGELQKLKGYRKATNDLLKTGKHDEIVNHEKE